MARGGYRKPANPAPVSGPGSLSRRTDGKQPVMNMAGGKYGEKKQLREMQQGAPMSQQASTPAAPKVTEMFAPTQRPDEPITAGMPFGEGANTLPVNNSFSRPTLAQTLMKAMQFNDDPDLEAAYNYLQTRGDI